MHRALLLLILLPAAACATTKAKAPEVRIHLDVPPPPPRVIEPLPSNEPASLEPVAELPNVPATTSRPRPAPQREPNKTEAPKPEPKPEATATDSNASPAAPAAPPVPPLRTPGSAEGAAAERQVRESLDRGKKMLDLIDAGGLTGDRRANYNGAKAFIQQAEEALKAGNYILAKSLAEKSEKIASQLAGR